MRSPRRLGIVLAFALGLMACETVRTPLRMIPGAGTAGPTEEELHGALGAWTATFQSSVVAACDRIRQATTLRDARRNCLFWQLRMIPLSTQAAHRGDAQESYVAVVALASAQFDFLSAGEGSRLFGPQQSIAIEAARRIEDRALHIGQRFLSADQLERLERQIDQLVAEHPISGAFAAESLIAGFNEKRESGLFGWVVDLPMVPFRALSGVSDTAQAVNTFNETAQEFTDTVAALPHLTRWQLELLLYEGEELESVSRALAAAEEISGAAEHLSLGADRISSVAETLPAEFSTRLEQARETIAELDALLARAEKMTGPLTHVADRVGEASAQWTSLLSAMPDAGSDDGGRPFDVREYADAADRIAAASQELRVLVETLQTGDDRAARTLLDLATWRAVLLIAVFFSALTAYRVMTSRAR